VAYLFIGLNRCSCSYMKSINEKCPGLSQIKADSLYLVEVMFDACVPAEEREVFCYEYVPWGWEESIQGDQVCVHTYLESRDQVQRLCQIIYKHFSARATCNIQEKENKDWQTIWQEFFEPRTIEKIFLILPSWEEGKVTDPFLFPVIIHPQMAFGTGDHPTTYLCLRALACLWQAEALKDNVFFLDLGTGSGILGIASALLGYKGIGLDIDPIALDNARLNCSLNEVKKNFCLLAGEIDSLKISRCFDLIFANIYAEPLQELSSVLGKMVKPFGFIILSGILQSQFLKVAQAYEDQGWQTMFILQRDGWVSLVLSRISF